MLGSLIGYTVCGLNETGGCQYITRIADVVGLTAGAYTYDSAGRNFIHLLEIQSDSVLRRAIQYYYFVNVDTATVTTVHLQVFYWLTI